MDIRHYPLPAASLGRQTTVTSLHFGTPGARPKVYLQASLHAEELPGMLVAHHLRQRLQAAEAAGQISGEVVLVPVANPIGLAQRLDHKPMGRFELSSSENFNRHYPDLAQVAFERVQGRLTQDGAANVATVRQAIADWLAEQRPQTELEGLRHTLTRLAFDADVVIDLHCDCEAVMHFYTERHCWPVLEPLSRYLGSEAVLLAGAATNGGPFDEQLSGLWSELPALLRAAGHELPLPTGCASTTVELRGEADVTHPLAEQDSAAVWAYLQHLGIVAGHPPALPPARCEATPLAGSETLKAPCPGVLVFLADVGQRLAAGDAVAEIIDPTSGTVSTVCAGTAGVFYARIQHRYIQAGLEIGKIAGAVPFRTGKLLGN
jgi:predicted deacylase